MFDRLKITFDQSNVTVILAHSEALFRSIENQVGSIEMGRGTLNFGEKHRFWKSTSTFWKHSSKHWNRRNKCMSMRWNEMLFQKPKIFKPNFLKHKFQSSFHLIFSSNKYVVHKSQDIFKFFKLETQFALKSRNF